MKGIIKYFLHRGEGVNQYSTENQTLWTLIKEIFHPELKNERRAMYWAVRMRGSGF